MEKYFNDYAFISEMVFERKLTKKEHRIIKKVITFVKKKQQDENGHDYSHALETCRWAIEISKRIKQEVDPFTTIVGALLHDIGRVGADSGAFHGIDGGSRVEEFMESLIDDDHIVNQITRIVVRHSPTTMIKPKTVEEKIVFDADTIERMGFMGMIRGIMGKTGSMRYIIEDRIKHRLADYKKLHFKESKALAKPRYQKTVQVVRLFEKELKQRKHEIHEVASFKHLLGEK